MSTQLTEDVNVVANSDLEITYFEGDVNIIQKLDDEPNDVGGLTSAELKAKFDEGSNIIKKFINESLIPEILAADATEGARIAAETERQSAEAERANAEAARVTAEQKRVEHESMRSSNESLRQEAEALRGANESLRQEAEALRGSSETARQQAETQRAAAEQTRASSEELRVGAEAARATAEQSRAAAEQNRVSAEQTRAAAEEKRVAAEQQRVTAETDRQQKSAAMQVWETYSNSKAYVPLNKVTWEGSSYICVAACTGVEPSNESYWLMIARKGQDGSSVLANGQYCFAVEDGRLILYYTGDTAPDFSINEEGHLILNMENGNRLDLGQVTGSGGSVELDATLSVSGKAADAKAVGDALKSYIIDVAELVGGDA